jgi:hypothetical protein
VKSRFIINYHDPREKRKLKAPSAIFSGRNTCRPRGQGSAVLVPKNEQLPLKRSNIYCLVRTACTAVPGAVFMALISLPWPTITIFQVPSE